MFIGDRKLKVESKVIVCFVDCVNLQLPTFMPLSKLMQQTSRLENVRVFYCHLPDTLVCPQWRVATPRRRVSPGAVSGSSAAPPATAPSTSPSTTPAARPSVLPACTGACVPVRAVPSARLPAEFVSRGVTIVSSERLYGWGWGLEGF